MPYGFFLAFIIARAIYTYSRKNTHGARPPVPWCTLRWWLIAVFLGAAMLTIPFAFAFALAAASRDPETAIENGFLFVAIEVSGFLFFFPWVALTRVAKFGNPRRAYFFAHALRFSYPTGE